MFEKDDFLDCIFGKKRETPYTEEELEAKEMYEDAQIMDTDDVYIDVRRRNETDDEKDAFDTLEDRILFEKE